MHVDDDVDHDDDDDDDDDDDGDGHGAQFIPRGLADATHDVSTVRS